MTTDIDTPGAPPPAEKINPFSRIAGALIAPAETFQKIVRKPDWVVPLILIVVLSVVSSLLIVPHVDIEGSIRDQLAEKGLKGEQADRAVQIAETFTRLAPWAGIILTPMFLLGIAGVLYLAFKLMAAEGGYLQYFSVVLYAWMPQVIKSIIMSALIFPRHGLREGEMMTLLKSNLGFLVDPIQNRIGFALLSSVDVFLIWTIVLLAIGLAYAARFSRAKSAAIVVSLFGVIVLGKVAIAAMAMMGGSAH